MVFSMSPLVSLTESIDLSIPLNTVNLFLKLGLLSIIGKCWFGRTIQTMQFVMKDFKTVETHIFIGDLINRIMTVLDGTSVRQMTIMAIS